MFVCGLKPSASPPELEVYQNEVLVRRLKYVFFQVNGSMSPEKKTPRITKSLGATFSIHFSLATSKLQDRGESVLRKVARKPQERRVPHSGTPAFGVLTICTEISVKNFRRMVLVFFWHRKQGRDWVVPFTKYWYTFRFLSTWSLALVIQTNGTEHFDRFGKHRKKVIPRKVLLFSRKISYGMNRPFEFSPKFPGFPSRW